MPRAPAFAALACTALCLALLAACSGMKHYPDSHARNAVFRVKNEGGSLFSSTQPYVHVFSVGRGCEAQYLGGVALSAPEVEIGLPVGGTVHLQFLFAKSTLGGQQSATAIEMTTMPRSGTRYVFNVSYLRTGYTATGIEFQPGQKGREVEHRRLRDCVATKS